jgi:hypothetical protein
MTARPDDNEHDHAGMTATMMGPRRHDMISYPAAISHTLRSMHRGGIGFIYISHPQRGVFHTSSNSLLSGPMTTQLEERGSVN